jgi:hypothetical protein
MRLPNGLFAFGALYGLAVCLSRLENDFISWLWIGFLFLAQTFWYLGTRPDEPRTKRPALAVTGLLAYAFILGLVQLGIVLLARGGHLQAQSCISVPKFLAVGDAVFCIKIVADSLPWAKGIKIGASRF